MRCPISRQCHSPAEQAVLGADLAQRILPEHQREQAKAERKIKADFAAVVTATLMVMVPSIKLHLSSFPIFFSLTAVSPSELSAPAMAIFSILAIVPVLGNGNTGHQGVSKVLYYNQTNQLPSLQILLPRYG